MALRQVIIAALFLLSFPQSAYPVDAGAHRQLLVVVTDSWDDFRASGYLFEKRDGKWELRGEPMPALVGKKGLGWDPAAAPKDGSAPVKKEGDGRSPAGIFPITTGMGYSPSPPEGSSFPYRPIEEGMHCVDDTASPRSNTIVSEKGIPAEELWKSSERMWEMGEVYSRLLVVDYNAKPPVPGNGSCIFIHVRRSPSEPTTGCTAFAADRVEEIMRRLRREENPALVQLPREVYLAVWKEWRLPDPALLKAPAPEAAPGEFVDVLAEVPGVTLDIRYAGTANFTGKRIYDCGKCRLRKGTAKKLAKAQKELATKGLSLKLWDCYRPLSAQKILWSMVPDPRFVADPKKGSKHNSGSAVDLTLVDREGRELEMPTPYDDFSPRASHLATDLPPKALENRRILLEAMQKGGFRALESEWWHYDDPEGGSEILDVPFSELCR